MPKKKGNRSAEQLIQDEISRKSRVTSSKQSEANENPKVAENRKRARKASANVEKQKVITSAFSALAKVSRSRDSLLSRIGLKRKG